MESEIAETKPITQELDPVMQEFFNNVETSINEKFENFKEKLESKKEELKEVFKNQLLEVNKKSSEVKALQESINSEDTDKAKLAEEAKKLRSEIEDLITRMEGVENSAANFKNKQLSEIINVKDDDFNLVLGIFGSASASVGENPANSFKPNTCRQCKLALSWGASYLTNHCSGNTCNSHYKYGCYTCNMSYCTQCSYPVNIEQCGCGATMVYTYAAYHSCDLCRSSIASNCWRCSTCDYDVCDTCWDKFKK